MSLKGAAAVVGVAELAPQRYTGEATILELLSQVATEAIADGYSRANTLSAVTEQLNGESSLLERSLRMAMLLK